ncbi:hypothetical protein, partial [Cupriavidus taiwanensis]|uniref:hypothetical protein n=1 Tax=Cupriavidus taiwanensis TaxID=164546 RepID=UPI0039EA53FD
FLVTYMNAPGLQDNANIRRDRIGCRLISGLAVQATPAGPDGFRRECPYLFAVLAAPVTNWACTPAVQPVLPSR